MSPLLFGGRLDLEVNIASSSGDRYVIARHLLQSLKCDETANTTITSTNRLEILQNEQGYVAADIEVVSKAMERRTHRQRLGSAMNSLGRSWMLRAVPPSCLRGVAIRTPSLGTTMSKNLETNSFTKGATIL